ncbi:hypothetical protein JK386_13600 [Nocardioides sp. zg-536]|uniref:Condensation domain-containing protein n=1 Tax=Nocardioides faecalis TaxID=2803858 RepID=A0A938Y821_9ACTN|nr:condensation domain-containing protein [Nocardioides faecalis]MBM9460934.1 hypothetical protein [Nocardioides faecalis]QVI59241.1 hypothetical protein KG111_02365 [Nocardioides faecalis]
MSDDVLGGGPMENRELSTYPLPAGTTTTWTPAALEEAWRADDRELSHDHAAHLVSGSEGSWIGCIFRVPIAYDAGAVRRALRAWVARHEGLRTTVRPAVDPRADATSPARPEPASPWRRETCVPEGVDVVAGTPVRHAEADGVRAELLETFARVRPTRWPHLLFATVEPDDDRTGFLLAFGADHSVMDGYSQVLWFEEILTLYRRALAGDTDRELARTDAGSHVDFASFDRSLGRLLTRHDAAVVAWRDFLAPDGDPSGPPTFPRYPDPALAEMGETPGPWQESYYAPLLDADQTDAANRWTRSLGTGLQALVIGALAATICEQADTDRLDFVLPVHTRHEARYATAIGWFVGISPVRLDLSGTETLADVVERTQGVMASVKHVAPKPFPRIAELLGVRDAPRFAISYADVRHTPGSKQWEEWEACTLRSPARNAEEVYFWVIRSPQGLGVAARCPSGIVAAERMHALLDAYRDLLRSAVRAQGAGAVRAVPATAGLSERVPA